MKVKPVLGQADIDLLKKTFAPRQEMYDEIDKRTRIRIEAAKEEIIEKNEDSILKLKSDLFGKIDPVLKEVTTNREERTIINHRLEKLENVI